VLIELFSDVVCPWCYLGARRLRSALEELDRSGVLDPDDVEVRWRAFQLDPAAPGDPQDLRSSVDRKYGPGSFDAMTARLVPLGVDAGIDYRFDLAQRVNTLAAHRLIEWAHSQPAGQHALVEALFAAYFTNGEDVSDPTTLVGLADGAGLDAGAAAAVLESDSLIEQVQQDRTRAEQFDITGVPAFLIDRRALIPGAQDVETLVRLLARIAGRSH
jgi:predicted DsbA family dithiol-disulfide isomerase